MLVKETLFKDQVERGEYKRAQEGYWNSFGKPHTVQTHGTSGIATLNQRQQTMWILLERIPQGLQSIMGTGQFTT